jgi:hypothetical protein
LDFLFENMPSGSPGQHSEPRSERPQKPTIDDDLLFKPKMVATIRKTDHKQLCTLTAFFASSAAALKSPNYS